MLPRLHSTAKYSFTGVAIRDTPPRNKGFRHHSTQRELRKEDCLLQAKDTLYTVPRRVETIDFRDKG